MKLICKRHFSFFISCALVFASCKNKPDNTVAFYYWKTAFALSGQKAAILQTTGRNLYLRMFDIKYDPQTQQPYPNAIVKFQAPISSVNVIPVIYITNETFVHLPVASVDSLATRSYRLLASLLGKQKIKCTQLQIDCDWTLTTRDSYFTYLKKLKKLSSLQLQATIRLHQIKYRANTGVPPVAKGVLMFYNMGKLQAYNNGSSSIYNPVDAQKYLPTLSSYPLPLDVALPLFSWVVHSRDGHILQLYQNLNRHLLSDTGKFILSGGMYKARKSFFLNGIYIKQNDNFKPEVTDLETLKTAAEQLSAYLPKRQQRTIIFYELANLDPSEFSAKNIIKISAGL